MLFDILLQFGQVKKYYISDNSYNICGVVFMVRSTGLTGKCRTATSYGRPHLKLPKLSH